MAFAFAASVAGCPRPPSASESTSTGRNGPVRLVLPARFEAALAGFSPGFRRWPDSEFIESVREGYPYTARQAPSAVIGDFNADEVSDAAVLGTIGSDRVVLALLDSSGSVRISELARAPHVRTWINTGARNESGEWLFLRLRTVREATRCAGVNYEDRDGEAIVLEYFGKASTVYYLDSAGMWRTGCGND